MKTERDTPNVPQTTDTLTGLVDVLANNFESSVLHKKSILINDIPDDIFIDTDKNLLANVLGNLMQEVIKHTENGSIRIMAKTFNNVVLLHVKNDGSLNYDSVSQRMNTIQTQAEKLGGFIGFTSYRNKVTTIAFSFMNTSDAA
jgi:K+-sensing histidine kinase KdpD